MNAEQGIPLSAYRGDIGMKQSLIETVKYIARRPCRIDVNHGKRGRFGSSSNELAIHAFRPQAGFKVASQSVGGNFGGQRRCAPKPRKSDRDVVGRSTHFRE